MSALFSVGIVAAACLWLTAMVLIVRDTRRRHGSWGVNLRDVNCPGCGALMPHLRLARSLRQFLHGGATCRACGCEVDKWGNALQAGSDL
jgi:hypothetical protein